MTYSFTENEPYVTVYESVGGWKAVLIWWCPEMGGYWEPYQTGLMGYKDKEDAIKEAKYWALNEGLDFKL